MSQLDTDILIDNINRLISNKGITQVELTKILGMSQPNISKALNKKEKKCFTLSQVYDLAVYFHVSIDELVDNQQSVNASTSPRSIAAFITKLAEAHKIDFQPYKRTEHIYAVDFDSYEPECTESDQEITYPAIIFPSYWNPEDGKTIEEKCELHAEASQIGNDTAMLAVNKYLDRFQEIFKIYENGALSKETYDTVIADLLSHLRE